MDKGQADLQPANRPQVSVVVTCYNYAHYLEGCLESLFAQTVDDLEIIVVDDGSTDDTAAVAAPFRQDPRLHYIYQANAGQANAKNTGIRRARGAFVAFLDADDRWDAGKLAQQLPRFDRPEVGVVYSRAAYIDAEDNLLDYQPTSPYLQPRAGWVSSDLFMDNFVPFSSAVVRRRCLEQIGGFDETLAMGIDWDLWLRISVAYQFDYVDAPLLNYRVGHSGQMSKNLGVRLRCADRIMASFFDQYANLLPPETVRLAYHHTFCNRGAYFRRQDAAKALRYYLRAMRLRPLGLRPYKGILKVLLRRGGRHEGGPA